MTLVLGTLCAVAVVLMFAEMVACACGRADRGLFLLLVALGGGRVAQEYLLWSDRAGFADDGRQA